ncbi:MAG: AbrB/MazE/SpoVT family DNA-binding domain-containing protein [Chloroflexi bacterium]|nr:AbrB/MazE/SpoVT family DNA-binding domain-containing protein [Chloroflexota bacterium]MCH8351063.1 AbrB/MazE/SpoVT family DNA-binding domain-containing protein [Chloroflexota bacterium]MCI0786499.1 AbrB/MazE/SpoVT family DNA-binding domain-containing protein [Chloroflexota bacterium]MCI0799695.1 AbrB/MazE/SpoVT family DNA-binding domain-containing protein [Chloroflexota bacterium]MCI0895926.1 AbrB/MazE/SpoVT family DNA-binding domain-containing protein [Chloroflexota bacterium]
MSTIVVKIGQGGRIVLPAQIRKALGVTTGDDLILDLSDGEVRMFTRREAIRRAQGLVRSYFPEGRMLSEELIRERKIEAARE